MDIDNRCIPGVQNTIYGSWVHALTAIDGDEPSHAAVIAPSQPDIAVEGNPQS